MATDYHYIITGAGLAGSSLLLRMIREPFFRDKKILVIDQSPKNTNDRTWCFWEKEAGLFEPIVHHRWNKIGFYSNRYSAELEIAPYQYKMIRSSDLYAYVREEAEKHPNIEWRYARVAHIINKEDRVIVETEVTAFSAEYVFNSILFHDISIPPAGDQKKKHLLLQHFKGWLIETEEPCFDAGTATFMDFRLGQEKGTAFMYVMPVSAHKALVEYTLFTETLLPPDAYEQALKDYIARQLQVKKYSITHEEFGVIPMTNLLFPQQDGRVVYTGIAGGQAKGSSGYAFQFIQKRTRFIVQSLMQNGTVSLADGFADKKFRLYDGVLLNVLQNRKMPGDEIFAAIFQKNPVQKVFRFLDNETGLLNDLSIMRSVPLGIFLPATVREILD